MLYLVIGGSGSGKSQFAENLSVRLKNEYNAKKLYYIAAMKPYGEQAQQRIAKHRKMRLGKGFETIECYTNVGKVSIDSDSVVLLECVSNLAANIMFDENVKDTADTVVWGIEALQKKCLALVAVTNNVFDDGIQYSAETVEYMRQLGIINQSLAKSAKQVSELVCGIELRLKPNAACKGE